MHITLSKKFVAIPLFALLAYPLYSPKLARFMRRIKNGPHFTYVGPELSRDHMITLLPTSGDQYTESRLKFFAQYLPPNPVIVDAGASHGTDSVKMAQLWSKGIVHAFEPDPVIFEELKKNAHGISNILCYPLALGDKNSSVTFHVAENAEHQVVGSGSLLKPAKHTEHYRHITFDKTIEVPCNTLETWAQEHKISHIDFLWLDMQGGELAMLQSAPTLLKTVKALYLEVAFVDLYEGQPLYKDVKQWLEQQGFIVVARDFEVPVDWGEGNAFFVRKELIDK